MYVQPVSSIGGSRRASGHPQLDQYLAEVQAAPQVQCTVLGCVQCAVCSVQYAVFSVKSTVFSVQCAECSVQSDV